MKTIGMQVLLTFYLVWGIEETFIAKSSEPRWLIFTGIIYVMFTLWNTDLFQEKEN